MIEIRQTLPEDTDDLQVILNHEFRFLRSVYRPTKAGHTDKSSISRDLTRLVAILRETVAGTIQYYIDNDFMRITGLAVYEVYRRQGIARALVNHVFELAQEKGCLSVRLSTIKETGNVDIFQKLGFEVIGENTDKLCEGINGEKVTDVEMERRLTLEPSRPGCALATDQITG